MQARVLGVRVDCLDMEVALERIEHLVEGGGHHLVATLNPEFVMRAQDDREFARVLESADLCLPDGTGVVWAARRQGCSISEPVPGVDLIPPLAVMCARRGFRLFLLGAEPGVAADLASRLRDEHPGLQVDSHPGSADPSSDAETLTLIRAHQTQVLLVAFGAPKQELWIDRLMDQLDVAVAIGVGGAFDYLTGRVPRAPVWVRKAGFEWLHRLVRQPWRARRMVVLPAFAFKVLSAGK
ncbi:MAG TPA: WecB/TagA/CpsF family glycosyltransferase [Candidatus Dormibacteraeota bacterium]|jgi:N-acetylglucosaminyldiphosphoundecaprenol N-acetyl-beta-D-mannosaminyltransferase|nr:WecB/TagA/CpsF family glycosyltransferase [Candidatus Dormibacteraeota bacterium]